MVEIDRPREIIYQQAPCPNRVDPKGRPAQIIADGEGETKEGICCCLYNGVLYTCCVDGLGIIIPPRLRDDIDLEKIKSKAY